MLDSAKSLGSYMLLVCCFVLPSTPKIPYQESTAWIDLEPGSYGVGFRATGVYDYSRAYPGADGRPIQVVVWYPTDATPIDGRMAYGRYHELLALEERLGTATEEERESRLESLIRFFVRIGAPQDRAEAIALNPTWAVEGAAVHAGSFPLIVYGAGGRGAAFENAALAEFLASHGYIVVASPSVGLYSHTMRTSNVLGLEAQARDMEFLLGYMHGFEGVDWDRTGVMGWSWGGLAGMLVQMRNPDLDAVLSLDGSIGMHEEVASESPFFAAWRAQVPYMFLVAEDQAAGLPDFFSRMKYSDAYYLGFRHLEHTDFSSRYGYMIQQALSGSPEASQRKKEGYEIICQYALRFFNAHLKRESESLEALRRGPAGFGIPTDWVVFRHKEPLPPPPTQEEFFAMAREEGVNRAIQVYDAVKAEDPDYPLFEEFDLVEFAFELFNREKRPSDAIELAKLAVRDDSTSYAAQGYLAELYRKNKDWREALMHFGIAHSMAVATSDQGEVWSERQSQIRDYQRMLETLPDSISSRQ